MIEYFLYVEDELYNITDLIVDMYITKYDFHRPYTEPESRMYIFTHSQELAGNILLTEDELLIYMEGVLIDKGPIFEVQLCAV